MKNTYDFMVEMGKIMRDNKDISVRERLLYHFIYLLFLVELTSHSYFYYSDTELKRRAKNRVFQFIDYYYENISNLK